MQKREQPPQRNRLLEAQDDAAPKRRVRKRGGAGGEAVLGPCSVIGCPARASYGKAGCEEHLALQPYAAGLMRALEEEARQNAAGRPSARQVEEARAILEEGEVWLRNASSRLGAPAEVAARALRAAGGRARTTRRGGRIFSL